MNRKWEVVLLVALPLVIMGMIIYNAGIMSTIYMTENGIDKDSKIYRARISPDKYDVTINEGGKINLNLELLNQGSFIWLRSGDQPVHLSYHILDENKEMLKFDNDRVILPTDMRPDDETKIDLEIYPYVGTGNYILEFDMVEENTAWFGDKGSPTTLVKLHVK